MSPQKLELKSVGRNRATLEDLEVNDYLSLVILWSEIGEALAFVKQTNNKPKVTSHVRKAILSLNEIQNSRKCTSSNLQKFLVFQEFDLHVTALTDALKKIHKKSTSNKGSKEHLKNSIQNFKRFTKKIGGTFEKDHELLLNSDLPYKHTEKGFEQFVVRLLVKSIPKEYRAWCRQPKTTPKEITKKETKVPVDFTAINILSSIGFNGEELEDFLQAYDS